MADFTDSCVHPEMDENKMRLLISPDKPTDVAFPYAMSSSVAEAAVKNDEEFKKIDHYHGDVLETSWWKWILRKWQHIARGSRYQTCNRVTALQGGKNDADCTRSDNSRCGMHEDLLFDIMLWLPVVSLLRFRSVCRSWCSLIDSHTFINQHYNHNSNKSCLLARHQLSSCSGAGYSYEFCLLSGNMYEVYSNLNYDKTWYSVNEITILNSCNGIVSLLSKESRDVALWNPARKQLRPLPKSSVYHKCLSLSNEMLISLSNNVMHEFGFGFGFDVKNNDYKCVKFLYCIEDKHHNMVEVYSLRTDSWRTIHKDDILPFGYIVSDAAYNKGTCFWIGCTHLDSSSPILISFDLNHEVFETMPLPVEDDPHDLHYDYHVLDLLNDKLCYIKCMDLGPNLIHALYFEIWMSDENGVKESWKNICKCGPIGSWSASERFPPRVLGLSKNGKFLLRGGWLLNAGELCLTDFDVGEEKYFELQNPKPSPSKFTSYKNLQNPNPNVCEFVWYDESLVSLKREDDAAHN